MLKTRLAPTPIIKNTTNQKLVVDHSDHENEYQYDPIIDIEEEMNTETMIKLSKIMNQLKKDEHAAIYKFLRRHQKADFFSPNNNGTYFNLENLPNKVKWELYRIVRMNKLHLQRENNLKCAQSAHQQQISNLDERLSCDKATMNVPEQLLENPSEKEKILLMKGLNNPIPLAH